MMMWRALQPKQIMSALRVARPSAEPEHGPAPDAGKGAPATNAGGEARGGLPTSEAKPQDKP